MYIKGTDKIKGLLDLSSVKLQLAKNSILPINDNDFWNSDIQIALKMGYISAMGSPQIDGDGNEVSTERSVRCINQLDRTLQLPGLNEQIGPNREFTIKESELNNPHIRAAVSRGLIKVMEILDTDDAFDEAFLDLGEEWEEEQGEQYEEKKAEAEAFQGQILTPAQQALLNAAKTKQVKLDTNEEIGTPTRVIDTDNPDPITTQPDDPKRKSVVWNPDGVEKKKPKKIANFIESAHPEEVNANENDPKGSTVVVNPSGQPLVSTMKGSLINTTESDDLSFVDEESKVQKRAAHPILGKQALKQKDDNIMLDLEKEDEERVKAHPVLGKKGTNQEVDFVG